MDNQKKAPSQAVEPLKVASARRRLSQLKTAHRNGMLKPVTPTARPMVQEIRVKATQSGPFPRRDD